MVAVGLKYLNAPPGRRVSAARSVRLGLLGRVRRRDVVPRLRRRRRAGDARRESYRLHDRRDVPARYTTTLVDAKSPRRPGFNERDVSNKPAVKREASGDRPLKGEHATGEREPYEWNDPDELENVAAITAPAVLPSPSARLALLCACAGPTCRALALREG